MKLVICLMGYQCSGIYKMKDYLIDRYGVKRFKGYTTRKKRTKENPENYNFVSMPKMIRLGDKSDLVGLRVFNQDIYVKRTSDIPEGFSVCVIDYNGYLELSRKVDTLPIFLHRDLRHRFRDCKKVTLRNQLDFMARDHYDEIQFSLAERDEDLIHIPYTGLVSTYLAMDGIMQDYIEDLNKFNPYTPSENLFNMVEN